MPGTVICYAEGRAGSWEAVCLDFDVAVQGKSYEEVIANLREAIALYLESVRELPEAERARLLKRRVPLLLRLGFFWHFLRASLFGSGRPQDKQRHEFTMPCPA